MDDLFINTFYEEAKNLNFNVKGLITQDNEIISLGSDSKLIGRIFELLSKEILNKICEKFNYRLEETELQTVYPDFTIHIPDGKKIAVDIKTTYRRYTSDGRVSKYGFTLGSYASFLRNNTKNIAYPYSEYTKHYVIGFIYDRNELSEPGKKYKIDSTNIELPYKNTEFFIQEKYKIAGEKPGSGNTENIGSVLANNIKVFKEGFGPFAIFGNNIFEDYWRGYPKYRATIKAYTTLQEYLESRKDK